jgi:hypothetical protein
MQGAASAIAVVTPHTTPEGAAAIVAEAAAATVPLQAAELVIPDSEEEEW